MPFDLACGRSAPAPYASANTTGGHTCNLAEELSHFLGTYETGPLRHIFQWHISQHQQLFRSLHAHAPDLTHDSVADMFSKPSLQLLSMYGNLAKHIRYIYVFLRLPLNERKSGNHILIRDC